MSASNHYKGIVSSREETRGAIEQPDVDELANFIRTIDRNHKLGAGILAENICAWLAADSVPKEDQRADAAYRIAALEKQNAELLAALNQKPVAWACWPDGWEQTPKNMQLCDYEPLAYDQRMLTDAIGGKLSDIIKFLLGEGPIDGLYFGDSDTNATRQRYWWREHLRRAVAALPAAATVPEWQPIETAPKDQCILLGRLADEEHIAFSTIGWWIDAVDDGVDYTGHDAGFVDHAFQYFNPGRSFGSVEWQHVSLQPTHWMPLPQPPAAQPQDDGEKP